MAAAAVRKIIPPRHFLHQPLTVRVSGIRDIMSDSAKSSDHAGRMSAGSFSEEPAGDDGVMRDAGTADVGEDSHHHIKVETGAGVEEKHYFRELVLDEAAAAGSFVDDCEDPYYERGCSGSPSADCNGRCHSC